MAEHSVNINSRTHISLTGVSKVLSINPNLLCVEVEGSGLNVSGSDLEIEKLALELGIVEAKGQIDGVKYTAAKQKLGFIKRIFK